MPYQNLTLPTIYVGKQPLPGFDPNGGGFSKLPSHGMSTQQMINNLQGQIHSYIDTLKSSISSDHAVQSQQLPQSVENDLATVRSEAPSGPLSPVSGVLHEIGITSTLIHRKTLEFNSQTLVANSFYGNDPINKTAKEFSDRASQIDRNIFNIGTTVQSWANSYHAAYSVRLLSQSLQLLSQRHANLQNQLIVAQVEEKRQLAAQQELQRIAEEFARLKSEADALARAQEEAQIAELKAQLADVERLADLARLEAEKQAEQLDERQRPIIASAGSIAAFGPAFSGVSGAVSVRPATSLALSRALRAALSALTGATVPVMVGFAALLMPSRLGNSDLYSASVPLSELVPGLTADLYELADTGREIDLPTKLGSRTIGNRVELVVASTDALTLLANVTVKLARYDVQNNVYISASPVPNGPSITWTPLAKPLNPSSVFPETEQELPIYEGSNVTPIEGRIDISPILDGYGFGGFITVFPAESGIPPLYVLFNSPYEGATTTGEHSERTYNPEQSGGPITHLEWSSTNMSSEGLNLVKLHTARFPASDANKVMIERLEKIVRGELEMTDTDKRYYTHEIRELERFRALGFLDDDVPDASSPVWNNVHTATLEDYKLKDDETLLYTADALAAADEQDERFYQRLLKEMGQ